MTKVLYIGVFDGTGWGRAATDYVLALDSIGVDVVPRRLFLNNQKVDNPRLNELLAKSSSGCNVVIQHVLPHQLDFNGRFDLNVAMYATETSDFRASGWADRINTMDRAVVFNQQSAGASICSGVRVLIHVVPHACDITRFQQLYPPLGHLRRGNDFIFYTIGETTRRKNLAALVKAFHLEFHPSESVQLLIKANTPGLSPADCRQKLAAFCGEIKRGLKLHGGKLDAYKEEILVTDRLTDQALLRLHATGNCFVQPSYGEAWSIPAFEAMAMGNTPIVTDCTGYRSYIDHSTGWLVSGRDEPVFGANDTFADLFVGTESWFAVDINHLRRAMREAFEQESIREEKASRGIERAYEFSYEAVGCLLKKVLEHERTTLDGVT